jgi:hypothetical protein
VKTSELQGAALDWAVAKCENFDTRNLGIYSPSTDWSQGGPIIERERIHVQPSIGEVWQAELVFCKSYGPTPLIAAMRCYVASKLCGKVDVLEQLK